MDLRRMIGNGQAQVAKNRISTDRRDTEKISTDRNGYGVTGHLIRQLRCHLPHRGEGSELRQSKDRHEMDLNRNALIWNGLNR